MLPRFACGCLDGVAMTVLAEGLFATAELAVPARSGLRLRVHRFSWSQPVPTPVSKADVAAAARGSAMRAPFGSPSSPINVERLERGLVACGHDPLDSLCALDILIHGANRTVEAPTPRSLAGDRPHLDPEREALVRELLAKEVALGRVMGPFVDPPFWNLWVSPFHLVPKPGASPPVRLIHDLSASHVNDFMAHLWMRMDSMRDAMEAIADADPDTLLLAKVGVKAAYRLIFVAPNSAHLLGGRVGDDFFVDRCLPFGARVAPA